MRNLTQKIVAVPLVLFLIVVFSAPMVTIHHVHRIETSEHADRHQSSTGQAVTEVPATYHETHIVTLLSGDSFNSSTRNDVVPPLHQFIATLVVVPVLSNILLPSAIASAQIWTPSQSSGDKCALFCSFLI